MKRNLPKKLIISLKKKYDKPPYTTDIDDIQNGKHIIITKEGIEKPIAEMKIIKMDDETDYYVTKSKSMIKGVGKLLYYLAMHIIYPLFLRPDSAGFSWKAKRIYDALEKTDYVEVEDTGGVDVYHNVEEDDEDDDENYSDKRYRFSFKKQKK